MNHAVSATIYFLIALILSVLVYTTPAADWLAARGVSYKALSLLAVLVIFGGSVALLIA